MSHHLLLSIFQLHIYLLL